MLLAMRLVRYCSTVCAADARAAALSFKYAALGAMVQTSCKPAPPFTWFAPKARIVQSDAEEGTFATLGRCLSIEASAEPYGPVRPDATKPFTVDTFGTVGTTVSEAEPIVGPSPPRAKVAENSTVVLALVAV